MDVGLYRYCEFALCSWFRHIHLNRVPMHTSWTYIVFLHVTGNYAKGSCTRVCSTQVKVAGMGRTTLPLPTFNGHIKRASCGACSVKKSGFFCRLNNSVSSLISTRLSSLNPHSHVIYYLYSFYLSHKPKAICKCNKENPNHWIKSSLPMTLMACLLLLV